MTTRYGVEVAKVHLYFKSFLYKNPPDFLKKRTMVILVLALIFLGEFQAICSFLFQTPFSVCQVKSETVFFLPSKVSPFPFFFPFSDHKRSKNGKKGGKQKLPIDTHVRHKKERERKQGFFSGIRDTWRTAVNFLFLKLCLGTVQIPGRRPEKKIFSLLKQTSKKRKDETGRKALISRGAFKSPFFGAFSKKRARFRFWVGKHE